MRVEPELVSKMRPILLTRSGVGYMPVLGGCLVYFTQGEYLSRCFVALEKVELLIREQYTLYLFSPYLCFCLLECMPKY